MRPARELVAAALTVALAGILGLRPASGQTPEGPVFSDVTQELGIELAAAYGETERPYVVDSGGAGAAWLDYDVDGRLDLGLANGLAGPSARPYEATRAALAGTPLAESRLPDGTLPHNELYRGGSTSGFTAAGAHAGIAASAWANAMVAGDLDNDGFPDLLVTTIGPNLAYRNNGDGTFSPWNLGADDARWATGAALLDWDRDGDLDVYIANYVDFDAATTATLGDGACFYLGIEVFCGPIGLEGSRDVFLENHGGAALRPWHEDIVDLESTFGFAVLGFDCDGTPGQELYVANDSNINLLYRRTRAGDLDDLSLFSGAGFSGGGREQAGMGVTASDADGDGDLDLLVSNFQRDYNTFYENLGDCVFQDRATETGLASGSYPYMAWASLFLDVDGDGDEDAFVANGHLYPQLADRGLEAFGQLDQLYLSRLRESGTARFDTLPARGALLAEESSRGASYGDFDDDGDLDLAVTRIDGPPVVYRNDGVMARPSLRLTLVGRDSPRSAYGAIVEVTSGGVTQLRELRPGDGYLSQNDHRMLIFLPGDVAERVDVRWTSGAVTVLEDVAPGDILVGENAGIIARRTR